MTTPHPTNRPGEYISYLEQKTAEMYEKQSRAYSSGYHAGWNDALIAIKAFCNKTEKH